MSVPHNVQGAIASLIYSNATSITIQRHIADDTMLKIRQACERLGTKYLDLRCANLDDTMARSHGHVGEIETGIDLLIKRAGKSTLIILDEAEYLDQLTECSRVIEEAKDDGHKFILVKYLGL